VRMTLLDVENGDGGSLGGKRPAHRRSNSAATAGDDDGSSIEAVRSGHGGLLTFS